MPTHHLHISTGFMFMTALFVIGFVAVIFAFVRSMKNDRIAADVAIERAKADAAYRLANPVCVSAEEIQRVHGERLSARQAINGQPMGSIGVGQHPAYYGAAAPVYAHDPITGLATGMMLGSMMGHSHDTTIIHDSSPSYVDSSPSYSSSSSSDSGLSYSSDSSSSYSDCGSSSGFDASW